MLKYLVMETKSRPTVKSLLEVENGLAFNSGLDHFKVGEYENLEEAREHVRNEGSRLEKSASGYTLTEQEIIMIDTEDEDVYEGVDSSELRFFIVDEDGKQVSEDFEFYSWCVYELNEMQLKAEIDEDEDQIDYVHSLDISWKSVI